MRLPGGVKSREGLLADGSVDDFALGVLEGVFDGDHGVFANLHVRTLRVRRKGTAMRASCGHTIATGKKSLA